MIEKALKIDGWMSDLELIWLARAAQDCKVIVEFGSYKGRSTRALGDNTTGIVFAVDPWDGLYFDNNNNPTNLCPASSLSDFVHNLKDLIILGTVIPYCARSTEFIFPPHVDKAGLVFIDGDHRYQAVCKDIEIARKLVKSGGIISGHDYTHTTDWPGVKQAVDEYFKEGVNTLDSIWWITV